MMGSVVVAWTLAGLALVVAVALYVRLRQIDLDLGQSRVGSEKLEGELRASRDQLQRSSAKLRRKSDELAELRKKHDKLRKRVDAGDGGGKPAATGSGATERELEEARQARDRAREEVESLTSELQALRVDHARLSAAPPPPPPDSISGDEAERLKAEAERARAAADESGAALAQEEKLTARLRKRLETQETAYVSLRGELEAKKDRLATQNEELERLRALKVAWVDASTEDGDVEDGDTESGATESGATELREDGARADDCRDDGPGRELGVERGSDEGLGVDVMDGSGSPDVEPQREI